VVSRKENALWMITIEPGFERKLEMPDGVTIQAVLPPLPEDPESPRRFLIMPGGTPPRIGVQVANRKGIARIVSLDPMTGFPRIENVENR